ncbi:MAG: insulinase family protein [Deltaproteobacteria bacterium]|nr:insulinase family protein [Deltaproteobacteria bacterium]
MRPSRRPRFPLALALAVAVPLAWGSGAAADAVEELGESFEDPAAGAVTTRLPNGLVVLTLEDHATPVVSFQVWVQVGSRDETRYTGLAHLFEHMMFKGSKNIEPEQHARLIQARGGRLNAWTNRDFTVYFEDVTSETLPLVIELEAERISNLEVTLEMLTSERQVVLEERRMRTEDKPSGRAYEALLATAFVAHPYRRPVIGWRSDVEAVTVEACQDFFDTFYRPNNIILSIVGDFDTDEALERIRETFGKLKSHGAIPRNPTLEPEQMGERRANVHFDLRSPVLAAVWHAPPAGHPDAEALDVASMILSGGRSSRLYQNLVYEAQQALYAEGGYMELQRAGLFMAYAGVRPDGRIEEVERLFFEQIALLREEPVSAAELAKAKRQLEVSLVSGLSKAHAVASRIALDVATFERIRPLEERLAAIRAVSAEDVQRVAGTYLVDSQRSVVRVVP